jgi:triosephosphate isomerase
LDPNTQVVVAPPALYLLLVREHLSPRIEVAAQNVFDKPNGAFTGEISVSQLKDSGITWAIVGHSERRTILGESDAVVASKTKYATDNGISVIWCCGESLEEREGGKTLDVITGQLKALSEKLGGPEAWKQIVIAYEPIWAIGTGKVATTEQAQDVHAAIRKWLKENVSESVADETRILYGGSVNGKNCKELATQPDIDGFLVGGASLKPECEFFLSLRDLVVIADFTRSHRHHQQQAVRDLAVDRRKWDTSLKNTLKWPTDGK